MWLLLIFVFALTWWLAFSLVLKGMNLKKKVLIASAISVLVTLGLFAALDASQEALTNYFYPKN